MSVDRSCGPRKSKKNPDAYTKEELVYIVVEKFGYKKSEASSMTKDKLCEIVKMKNKKDKEDKEDKEDKRDKRSCGPRKTKNNNAYSRSELVELAISRGIKKSDAKKMRMKDLCVEVLGEEPDDEKEVEKEKEVDSFDYEKCKSYSLDQLKNFSRIAGLSTSGGKKSLCDSLVSYEIEKLKDSCLSMDFDIIKNFAKEKGISSSGSKKTVCERIMNVERKRVGITTKELDEVDERDEDEDYPCITKSKLPLKNYQRRVVKHMLTHRGLLTIFSPGMGKTLTAVTSIECVLSQNPKIKIVIITPASLVENMKKEFRAYGADPDDSRITFSTIKKFSNDFDAKKVKCRNTFLIVDEAQNLKSYKGKSADSVIECAKKCSKVLLLSATPVMNRPNEIVNLISMIDGEDPITPSSFDKYIMTDDREFENYFKCKVSIVESVRTEDYPESEEHMVEFVMDKKYYKAYRDIEKGQETSLCRSLFGCGRNLQAFYNGIRRAANNIESENGPKINWIIDYIQKTNKKNKRNKTLIYSSFLNAGSRLVMKRLDKLKIPYTRVDGTMSKKDRKISVDKYNSGEINILFISKAGGEGLDLKGTRGVIITEPAWNDANLEQVKGRAIRYKSHSSLPTSERKVDIWNLYMMKPSMGFRDEEDISMESIDVVMTEDALVKKTEIQEFMNRLKELSIENNKC